MPAVEIPDYQIIRRIGGGSYGEVWLARGLTGAYYAVKVVYRQTFDEDRPFEREFSGLQNYEPVSRSHESQVPILHVGGNEKAGYFYYVMELADDQETGREVLPVIYTPRTLQSERKRLGRLPFDECVRIGLALATALGHMHRHGLVHRDIKPANIIFINGNPRLADPGLVTLVSETHSFVGTEGYLPPEGPGTPQADLFSLGKVLYEISLGRDRKDFPELPAGLNEWPDRNQLIELNEVILKACHADPRQRYQSAEEIHADLSLLQTGKSLLRLHAMIRQLALLKKAALVVLVLAGIIGLAYLQASQSAQKSRLRLAQLNLAHGQQLAKEQDLSGALAWSVEAFKLTPAASPTEAQHRLRLGIMLAQCPPVISVLIHEGPVQQSLLTPDGRYLITAGGDKTVRIWDWMKGQPHGPAIEYATEINRVAIGPKANQAATACASGLVSIWEIPSGKPRLPALSHPAPVNEIAFSPDGKWLLSGCGDGVARLWDAQTGVCQFSTPPLSGPLRWTGFSPDGRLFAIAASWRTATNSGGQVQLWSVESKQRVGSALQHRGPIISVCFASDSPKLLTTSEDRTACIWATDTGQPLTPHLRHNGPVLQGLFSPDNRCVVTAGSDQVARIWDADTGELRKTTAPHGSVITYLAFRPDGRAFVTCSVDQTAVVWDAVYGLRLFPPLRHGGWVQGAVFSPNGEKLITWAGDRAARVWNLASKGLIAKEISLAQPIMHMDVNSDASLAVITSSTNNAFGEAQVLDLQAGTVIASGMNHAAPIWKTRFSPDGTRLATGGADRLARLWNSRTGVSLSPAVVHGYPVWQIGYDSTGHKIVTASGVDGQPGEVRVWEADTGRLLLPPIPHAYEVMDAQFSPDNHWIATGSGSVQGPGELRVLNAETGQDICPPIKHDRAVWLLAFSPAGDRLAAASLDHTVRLWSPRTGQPLVPPLRHSGWINTIQFSPEGRTLLTASVDQNVRLWHTANGRLINNPLKHAGPVLGASFSADGSMIISACADGTVSLWEARTGEALAPSLRHPAGILQAFLKPAMNQVVTSCQDQKVRVWKLPRCGLALPELEREAILRSGYRVNANGGLDPLSVEELRQLTRLH